MPEVGTIEGIYTEGLYKFKVNRLNRTRDFVNQIVKSIFEKNAFSFNFYFYTQNFS